MCSVCDIIHDNGGHISEQSITKELNEKPEKPDDLLNVESIYFCDQYEFDTDESEELDKHNSKKVHNVENQNKTLPDNDEEQS